MLYLLTWLPLGTQLVCNIGNYLDVLFYFLLKIGTTFVLPFLSSDYTFLMLCVCLFMLQINISIGVDIATVG